MATVSLKIPSTYPYAAYRAYSSWRRVSPESLTKEPTSVGFQVPSLIFPFPIITSRGETASKSPFSVPC